MSSSVRITEAEGVVGTIQTKNGVGSYYSDAIALDADNGRRFVAYVNGGAIGSSGTVDFEFQWSATSGGTYATITGSALVQDVAGGKTHRVEISTEQIIKFAPTATYMKGYLKTLVAATPVGVVIVSEGAAHLPAASPAANLLQTITTLA